MGDEFISVKLGDSLDFYSRWDRPTVIVSDGGYGVLGFEGDTSDHSGLPEWYKYACCFLVTILEAIDNAVVLEF